MSVAVIDVATAEKISKQALLRAGVPVHQADLQIQLLLYAELSGHASHGLLRLPRLIRRIGNGVADPVTAGASNWRGDAYLDVDGENGLGPVVAMGAIDAICERARRTGVALAGIRNCNHLGMLAWYADHIARRGQVAMLFTTAEALVHPWGGRRPMMGTNPIAIGVPAEPHPMIMDMATSLVSMGKIHDFANRAQPIPPGWALDEDGEPTTDAQRATRGAVAPFGGPKGYALGVAFEVLVTALTASAIGASVVGTLDADQPCNKGDVVIVIEPAKGVGPMISRYLQDIRDMEPAEPGVPVLTPGDRARAARERNAREGLTIAQRIWQEIVDLAQRPA